MASTQNRQSLSTFHSSLDMEDTPIRRLTETGTLYTGVGNSNFFAQNQLNNRTEDTVERKRSLTGSTVLVAGQSQFFSKPPVEELAYTPPHIVSKEIKPLRKATKTGTVKFPQLKEFAHFHYNKVDIGKVSAYIDEGGPPKAGENYKVVVNSSSGTSWVVHRSAENFILLDRQIHYCVFDRNYSQLPDIELHFSQSQQNMTAILTSYLKRFSSLSGNSINCGTVLNFFELSSNGGRLISSETNSAINIPAVANAIVVKAFHASDFDELELKEGDLISVIDKPPASVSSWWRGKKELTVGFFPSECVEVIGTRKSSVAVSQLAETEQLPVLQKRGKFIAFLLQFFSHRPAISQLKQSGIVKDRLFGSDLGEHLANAGLLIPKILVCCCEAIERHGLIDGIYRLSGRVTQVQTLRDDFDLDRHECFTEEELLDIHAVSTLLKTYFRELPNPLLTFQLYDALVSAVQLRQERKQVAAVKAHISTLPPPHYRTAKYLFAHLARLTAYSKRTSMTSRNLAIVWAPNLIRYEENGSTLNAFAVLQNVSLQAAVTDLLITHYDKIFVESGREENLSPFNRKKPAVMSLSKRLMRLSVARKKKWNGARNCNSSADLPVLHSVPLEEDAAVLRSKVSSENLSRAQSISLDSIFASSIASRVHMLHGSASGSTPMQATNYLYDSVVLGENDRPGCSKIHYHSTTLNKDVTPEREVMVSGKIKPVPLPKPRLIKKVHDYVNLSNLNKLKDEAASPRRQSSQHITGTILPNWSSKKPSRPYTMYDTAESVLAPHTDLELRSGKKELDREPSHYAVSDVTTGERDSNRCSELGLVEGTPVISETETSKFSDGPNLKPRAGKISASGTDRKQAKHQHVAEYNNYVLPAQNTSGYENIFSLASTMSQSRNEQFQVNKSNNSHSFNEDALVGRNPTSLSSMDLDTYQNS